jgi:isopentenyl-diphosphate delta-isomerase
MRINTLAKQTPTIIPAIAADGSLYPIEKIYAHRQGAFHLAVSIFVLDGDKLLIQRRADSKYHCGGQWANTCCSHPYWGESLGDCAHRRLKEELGFSVRLAERRTVEYAADVGGGLREHEKVTMYAAEVDRESIEIRPDPEEVAEVRWVTPTELHEAMSQAPENFTPWFRIYVERFPDLVV